MFYFPSHKAKSNVFKKLGSKLTNLNMCLNLTFVPYIEENYCTLTNESPEKLTLNIVRKELPVDAYFMQGLCSYLIPSTKLEIFETFCCRVFSLRMVFLYKSFESNVVDSNLVVD